MGTCGAEIGDSASNISIINYVNHVQGGWGRVSVMQSQCDAGGLFVSPTAMGKKLFR